MATITSSRYKDFVPTWRENDRASAPIKVSYKYPSTEVKDRFIRWSSPTVETTNGKDAVSKLERMIDRKGLYLACEVKIEGLTINDGEKEWPVQTGRELLDVPGLNDLYDEIVADIISWVAIVDVKN